MFSVLIKRYFGKCVLHKKGLQYKKCQYFHPVGKKFRTPHRSLVHSAVLDGKVWEALRRATKNQDKNTPRRGAEQDTAEHNIKDTEP